MEDYEYKVIKLHATQSRNISKFTSDISKNTGKLTSKTNQIKVRGGHGGLPPSSEDLEEPRHWVHLATEQGTGYTVRPMRPVRLYGDSEGNGHPFTTFDSFPTFLRAYCRV